MTSPLVAPWRLEQEVGDLVHVFELWNPSEVGDLVRHIREFLAGGQIILGDAKIILGGGEIKKGKLLHTGGPK